MPLALLLAQSAQSRVLNGCIAVAMGVGVIAFARTDYARRVIYRITSFYSGDRMGRCSSRYMPYAYYLGGAFFIVVGLLAVVGILN